MRPPELVDEGVLALAGIMVGLAVLAALAAAFSAAVGPLVASGVAALVVGGVYRLAHPPLPPLGGARWASLWQLRRGGWTDPEGYPLGLLATGPWATPVYLPRALQPLNVLLIAPPGMGKSVWLVHLLRGAATNGSAMSYLVVDPGGGLYARTADLLAASGLVVHRVAVGQPALSTLAIDPLASIPGADDPGFMARCVVAVETLLAATQTPGFTRGDSYWTEQATNVLVLHLMLRKIAHPACTWPEVVGVLAQRHVEGVIEAAHAYLDRPGVRARADLGLRLYLVEELVVNEKARAGVLGTLMQHLALLTDPRCMAMLGGMDGDADRLPRLELATLLVRPTVVFLQAQSLTDTTLPLVALACATMVAAIDDAVETKGQRLPRDLRIITDELGTLGPIYQLPKYANYLRSFGVGLLLTYQSTAQIMAQYPTGGRELLGAMGTTVMLGGTAGDDAELMARRLGKRETWGTSVSPRGEHSHARQVDDLLTAERISRMRFQAVVNPPASPALIVDLVKGD